MVSPGDVLVTHPDAGKAALVGTGSGLPRHPYEISNLTTISRFALSATCSPSIATESRTTPLLKGAGTGDHQPSDLIERQICVSRLTGWPIFEIHANSTCCLVRVILALPDKCAVDKKLEQVALGNDQQPIRLVQSVHGWADCRRDKEIHDMPLVPHHHREIGFADLELIGISSRIAEYELRRGQSPPVIRSARPSSLPEVYPSIDPPAPVALASDSFPAPGRYGGSIPRFGVRYFGQ